MDKNTYETYDYLPANGSNAEVSESDQFFVVQDDGTFLINRQVQYVAAQIQDKKEVIDGMQSCTIYDVTPSQPFLVDVENSTQLISVPDNLILPDGATNLYGNHYFLQPAPDSSAEAQMEVDVEQFKDKESQEEFKETEMEEVNVDVDNNDGKQSSVCTEITLSDEQYNMLEQKGWVLLQTNDKVFLLDTLGLHDITNKQELIEQLQAENQSSNKNVEIDTRSNEMPNEQPRPEIIPTVACQEQDSVEFFIDDGGSSQIVENIPETTLEADSEGAENNTSQVVADNENVERIETPIKMECRQPNEIVKEEPKTTRKDNSTVRIKTKFLLKDIPDKIVLGRTVNGKKLVAKVLKPVNTDAQKSTIVDPIPPNQKSEIVEVPLSKNGLPESLEWQFEKMVREALHGARAGSASASAHVAAARGVLARLDHVPAFQLAVLEHNLVVTKSVRNKEDDVETETMAPSLVTGRVTPAEGGNRFVYIPDMLQKLMSEMESSHTSGSLLKQPAKTYKDHSVLHMHVTESKCGDASEGVSITLSKRQLEPFSEVRKQYEKVYACSACANIFESEADLTDHQENQCMDSENTLTIDTDNLGKVYDENIKLNPYYILKTDKGTLYACLHCTLKFNKLSNCQRHIKTHVIPLNVASAENENDKQRLAEPSFKCKMCSSSYFHPSTLSKHIVAAHIIQK